MCRGESLKLNQPRRDHYNRNRFYYHITRQRSFFFFTWGDPVAGFGLLNVWTVSLWSYLVSALVRSWAVWFLLLFLSAASTTDGWLHEWILSSFQLQTSQHTQAEVVKSHSVFWLNNRCALQICYRWEYFFYHPTCDSCEAVWISVWIITGWHS